ncbi:glycerol-3-phosphate acyltransferase 1-like [Typha latifolia]|uniref:glycerol-3-phosphate acyltransferase 1-like n=1 Tax=Typha latifolia TaxID=4733 RepID=UPI003C2BD6E6
MVFPVVQVSVAKHWLASCQRTALNIIGFVFQPRKYSSSSFAPKPPLKTISCTTTTTTSTTPSAVTKSSSLVCDFQTTLLRTQSFFPFFMLVAFEGGSPLRALVLLLFVPFLMALGYQHELSIRVMVFITFCGLRTRDMEMVARVVLPKFYLESLNFHAFEVMSSTRRRVVVTSLPRVMVEGFLREYLEVDEVVGSELQVVGNYYFSGLISKFSSLDVKQRAIRDLFKENRPDVVLVSSSNPNVHLFFISHCKEIYVVNNGASSVMPREKYPKPLIFHDGRLAFLPSPLATFSLFLWLPLGLTLAIIRIATGIALPYELIYIVSAVTGIHLRVQSDNHKYKSIKRKGILYVCNHKTLLDPVMVSTALGKKVTAVTYSLSKLSEIIAPMRTVRLTRNRETDFDTMKEVLTEGDVIVCPEGTTCREPYVLRFSSLFARLTDDITPVAVGVRVCMLHGTTASGRKWLDPILFMMNPTAEYCVKFLESVPAELTCAGGCSELEVANRVQRQLGDALGFECTGMTRKDKYLMLAGHEGLVKQTK